MHWAIYGEYHGRDRHSRLSKFQDSNLNHTIAYWDRDKAKKGRECDFLRVQSVCKRSPPSLGVLRIEIIFVPISGNCTLTQRPRPPPCPNTLFSECEFMSYNIGMRGGLFMHKRFSVNIPSARFCAFGCCEKSKLLRAIIFADYFSDTKLA